MERGAAEMAQSLAPSYYRLKVSLCREEAECRRKEGIACAVVPQVER
jgi:hypothetical protein